MFSSSQLYHSFDQILLLAHGHALYSGPGGFAPAEHFSARGIAYKEGYNVADYLLDVASDAPLGLFELSNGMHSGASAPSSDEVEKGLGGASPHLEQSKVEKVEPARRTWFPRTQYAATFLTQLEVLSGREWKILRRDKTLFLAHVAVASVLGVFCGGLYFDTDITIAGFQSRVGCLFFLVGVILPCCYADSR